MKGINEYLENASVNEAKKTHLYDALDLAYALEEIVDQLHACDGDEVSVEVEDGRMYVPVFNLLDKMRFEMSDVKINGKRTHKLIL